MKKYFRVIINLVKRVAALQNDMAIHCVSTLNGINEWRRKYQCRRRVIWCRL